MEDEVKDIDSLIDQGLNAEKSELDLREKELEDDDIKQIVASDKVKGVTALFVEFNDIGDEVVVLAKRKPQQGHSLLYQFARWQRDFHDGNLRYDAGD